MYKIKTLSSVAKRFKKTKKNKYIYKNSYMRHLLTKKSSKKKRLLRKKNIIYKTNNKLLKKCLPYA